MKMNRSDLQILVRIVCENGTSCITGWEQRAARRLVKRGWAKNPDGDGIWYLPTPEGREAVKTLVGVLDDLD